MVMERSVILVCSEVYSTSSAAYIPASVYLCSKIQNFVQKYSMTFGSLLLFE